ncbi:MAG: YhdH/YhfP family quinone oxidoreductase [Paludibacter sp.]|nr:YhdH/YhfP family quinone oxidoreductase [Paludibacter sp.]
MEKEYKALVVNEVNAAFEQTIQTLHIDNLPKGDVLVKVHYSSINYKDALSATGNKGITKKYPHTPGIDAAGEVVSSLDDKFKEGDKVIVTGYDLGMNTSGGFGQYIRVPADWVVKLPEGLSLKESMIIGTAGFTAGISVLRLSALVKPSDGKILVSGATGGVGSVALSLLSKLGYQTIAISGKETEYPFLRKLGASDILPRAEFQEVDKRPILSAQYAGAIDTVGGPILENILKSLQPLGAVTTCGSVSATQLNMTVFPFILRGISLIGISAQNYPGALREPLWVKLATDWKPDNLLELYTEIRLEDIPATVALILQGKLKGRTIVNMLD